MKQPTKAQQQEAADIERSRQHIRVMLHTTLLQSLRGLTFDQVVEAWWAANFSPSTSQQTVERNTAHLARAGREGGASRMSHPTALAAIKAANLPAPTYRTARELLDLAADRYGSVRVAPETMRQIALTESDGTARRHLTDLAAAGIIHYSVNGDVWISFTAWPAALIPCAPTRTQCAQDAPEESASPAPEADADSQNARPRAPSARSDTQNERETRPGENGPIRADTGGDSGWLVGTPSDPDPGSDPNQPTNQPQDARTPDPPPQADEPTVDLLIAVGIEPPKARELAAAVTLDEALRYVAAWLPDYEAGKVQPGALITRIAQRWNAPPIPASFRQHRLYRDYGPRDVSFYAMPSETPLPIAAPEKHPDLAEPWKVVQWEARNSRQFDETFWGPLQSATLERAPDVDGVPLYRVALPAGADLKTIENRMGVWARRTLGSLLRQKCLVEFVALESEPHP